MTIKPLPGQLIEWDRPLCRSLAFAVVPGQVVGPNFAGPSNATGGQVFGGAVAGSGTSGEPGVYSPSTTAAGAYWPLPAMLTAAPLGDLSVAVRAAVVATTSYSKLLCVPYAPGSGWAYPYTSLAFYFNGSTIYLDVAIGSSIYSSSTALPASPADGKLSTWVATRQGSTVTFYRDGKVLGTSSLQTGSVTFPAAGGTVNSLNRSYQSPNEGLQGYLGGAWVWTRALASAEQAQVAADPGFFAEDLASNPIPINHTAPSGGAVVGGSTTPSASTAMGASGGLVAGGSTTPSASTAMGASAGVILSVLTASGVGAAAPVGGVVVGATTTPQVPPVGTGGAVVGSAGVVVGTGQGASGGATVGGSASPSAASPATGGLVVGGSTSPTATALAPASGGASVGGSTPTSMAAVGPVGGVILTATTTPAIRAAIPVGGALAGGSSPATTTSQAIASGGATMGGSASPNATTGPVASGGAILTAATVPRLTTPAPNPSGGAVVGGSTTPAILGRPSASGGPVVGSGGITTAVAVALASGGSSVSGSTSPRTSTAASASGGPVVGSGSGPTSWSGRVASGGPVVGSGGSLPSTATASPATGGPSGGGSTTPRSSTAANASGGPVVGGTTSPSASTALTASGGVVVGDSTSPTSSAFPVSVQGAGSYFGALWWACRYFLGWTPRPYQRPTSSPNAGVTTTPQLISWPPALQATIGGGWFSSGYFGCTYFGVMNRHGSGGQGVSAGGSATPTSGTLLTASGGVVVGGESPWLPYAPIAPNSGPYYCPDYYGGWSAAYGGSPVASTTPPLRVVPLPLPEAATVIRLGPDLDGAQVATVLPDPLAAIVQPAVGSPDPDSAQIFQL